MSAWGEFAPPCLATPPLPYSRHVTSTDDTPAEAPGPTGKSRADGRSTGPRKRRRRWPIVLGVLGGLVILAVGAVVGYGLYLDSKLERFADPFAGLDDATRPTAAPTSDGGTAAVNILILGSDSRISAGDPESWEAGAQRTDAIMIAHLTANRQHAYVMSIPRDSWVDIPGHGQAKINAAYSYGGPALMTQTVEELTNIRIDHVAIADFESFTSLTDALGGVDITVPEDAYDRGELLFTAGEHHMDGKQALKYTRQRYGLPGGDFDRVKRQQNWLRAMAAQAIEGGSLTNPVRLTGLLDAVTESVAVDETFGRDRMVDLARGISGLQGEDLEFLTIPTTGTGWSPDGKQSIVVLDEPAMRPLLDAIADDSIASYLKKNPDAVDLLDETVR